MPQLTLLRGGRAALPEGRIERADVLLEGGKIVGIRVGIPDPDGARVVEVSGLILAPGFVDVHVHGGGGHSLITTDASEIAAYAAWVVSRGVTSFLATICAGDLEEGIACARAVQSVIDAAPAGGANILGVNFEGPFVSPDRRGALPPKWLRAPDPELLVRLTDAANVCVITVAPELEGGLDLIVRLAGSAPRVSVGHSDATYKIAREAFESGASHVTHAFNAMRPLHHRDPGPVGAAIEASHVTIEVIADGVHLHPATVGMLVRAAGVDRVCLVTDAVTPAGLGSGTFRIGEQEATLGAGAIRLPDGTIAGSAATMDAVVRNVVEWGAADLASALQMASGVPARVADVDACKGRIAEGYDADLVALSDDLRVAKTWVGGNLVYESGRGV